MFPGIAYTTEYVFVKQSEGWYVQGRDGNSVSNKALRSQCPSINDLLTSLATSKASVRDQLPVDDELDGFSGHCWFALWREREREGRKREVMNVRDDTRKEGEGE